MSGAARWLELVGGPFRASWRAGVGWALVFVLTVVSTVAFWPAFKGSTALTDAMKVLPQAVLEAFGLQDFASPAGYLRGGLYEVIVPLMFAAAGVMFANSATAAEEDAGRLELFVGQPVGRRPIMVGRSIAVAAWLTILGLIVLVAQLLSDAVFDLEIGAAKIVSTVALCGLLAGFYAGLALAVAGLVGRPSPVLAVGLALAIVGYLIAALFPLSDVLEPWTRASPWEWALGGDPLVNDPELWRYAALALPGLALAAVGVLAFDRRDIRSP